MLHISQLISNIKDRHLKGRLEVEQISRIISSQIGLSENIPFSKVKIHNTKISVTAHPMIKHQISLKKRQILEDVNREMKKNFSDIY